MLKILGRCRVNTIVSGGTGSGKTTLLNCLTQFIDDDERIITCEDAAELQLQQPHVVRLETRPPNLEGEGQVTMRDLVKNCLRMRPERIIVGEVRGPEAFDLLQAMNTGHDGSMGTLHANSPREALSRIESMITMGGYSLPSQDHPRDDRRPRSTSWCRRRACATASRKITHITEVIGMEGDVIITQDLFVYEMTGEDAHGNLIGAHKSTGIGRPKFWDRARYYGEEKRLAAALDAGRNRRDAGAVRDLPAMKMQTLALFGMVATAIGGVAYVFIYPLLSGERKVEQRRASVTRAEPAARATGRTPQKSRREQVEETLKELDVKAKKPKNLPLHDEDRAGRPVLVEKPVPDDLRRAGAVRFRGCVRHGRQPAAGAWPSASPRRSACRDGCCRFSRSAARRSSSTTFPTAST